jgi:cytidylate kinase
MIKKYIFESDQLPSTTLSDLIEYYKGTDQREILNDSYSRYPYLYDFDYDDLTVLDLWFLNQMPAMDSSNIENIIIQWEW